MSTVAGRELNGRAQSLEALGQANAQRLARAELRAGMRAGRVLLADVLCPAHPLVATVPLVDVLRWQFDYGRGGARIEAWGRRAVRDNVNLLCPAGRASASTRAWVVKHAVWGSGGSWRRED